ncbi:OmpA family protein [Phenylobacterium sp.]|uniref:OmpA family protein n=1 Tax=Phenylobacterium sp. TaxID=1871053 RepID=UPI0035B2F971
MLSRVALALGATAMLAACTTTDPMTGEVVRDNRATGAILGALAGAGLGYATNTNKSEEGRTNAVIGAGIGALGGAAVGHYMDRQQAQLREQLRGSGVDVTRQGDNIVLDMPGDITFAYDRADIRPEMRTPLDGISRTLQEYPSTLIDVVGHADSTGSDAYNQGLSERRANAVATYLMDRGVQRERMFVAGRGETQPKASNDTDAGRAENRRVEIILRPLRG